MILLKKKEKANHPVNKIHLQADACPWNASVQSLSWKVIQFSLPWTLEFPLEHGEVARGWGVLSSRLIRKCLVCVCVCVQGWGFGPPSPPNWKCIPDPEAGCDHHSHGSLGDDLGRAKIFRPIGTGWWRSPAVRGYRGKVKEGKLWRKPESKAVLKGNTRKERRKKQQL